MRKLIKSAIAHPLISGSTIIFVGAMAASVLNYFFNLLMGRFLSVSEYGTFAALISIFNIFSVFDIALTMVFSKFSASLAGQKKEEKIGSLFIAGSIWVGIFSFALCLLLVFVSPKISDFLNINSTILVIIIVVALFFSFLSAVSGGVLQGLLKFYSFSFIRIISSVSRLTLGIVFVFLGYKIFGAIMAFFLSSLAAYIFAFYPLRKYIMKKAEDGFTLSSLHKKAYSYAVPVFLSNIGITALISLDIILVKHYFNSSIAGRYAALSLMGRAIFYFVSPISAVLFPIIAQKKERKEGLTGTLLMSIALISIPAIFLSAFYFIFPKLVLRVFFPGSEYAIIASLLGPFSIFIIFYTISFLLNNFYLSLSKTKIFLFTLTASTLETIAIIIFHDSIEQVVMGLIVVSFLLLISLLLYYPRATGESK